VPLEAQLAATMDGFDYDPMMMDGEPEQPQVKISAVRQHMPKVFVKDFWFKSD
jgi:hypothetical protein